MLLTHSYWPEHSPPQRRWQSLMKHLRPYGWSVTVVAPIAHYSHGPDYRTETRGRVTRTQIGPLGERILRVPFLTGLDDRFSKLLDQVFTALGSGLRGLLSSRADVVVVTAPSLPLLAAGWWIARLHRLPLIVEMRDAWPNLVTDSGVASGTVQDVINTAVEFVQNHADGVVTVTEGFAETLRRRGVKHVTTIRNGVLLSRTPQLPPPPLERSRLEVLYLGNHGESQRLERLIDAARIVGPGVRLTMVGQGSQKETLIRYALRQGVEVNFLEPVYRDEVFHHYRNADSLVISLRDDWSSFQATIPSKTYEVMAVGRHITAVVKGEAALVLDEAGAPDVVGGTAKEIARLWKGLIEDRGRLMVSDAGRKWVAEHADYADLATQYNSFLRGVHERVTSRRIARMIPSTPASPAQSTIEDELRSA